MAKVLVLYTGGTIGMAASANGYVPSEDFGDRLAAQLATGNHASLPSYDLVTLDRLIDSANLVLNDWLNIACALQQRWAEYDGFVVLHGTDTMAYTGAALSFLLAGQGKPVIMTGSQIPLIEARNDALDNFVTSLLFACQSEINEVCLCFNGKLLRANRATKVKTAALDAFDSPNSLPLGEAGIALGLNHSLLMADSKNTHDALTLKGLALNVELSELTFAPDAVAVVPIYPSMSAEVLKAVIKATHAKAIILETYGAGNVPDANTDLMDALKHLVEEGCLVVNITQCASGAVAQGAYATGAVLNGLGVIAGCDMTREAAFAKLHVLIALGKSVDEMTHLMRQSLCGELTE